MSENGGRTDYVASIPEQGFRNRPLDALRQKFTDRGIPLHKSIIDTLSSYDALVRVVDVPAGDAIVLVEFLQLAWDRIYDLLGRNEESKALGVLRAVRDYLELVSENEAIRKRDLSLRSAKIQVDLDGATEDELAEILFRLAPQ